MSFFGCSDNYTYEEFVPPTFGVLSCNTISDDECIIEIEVNHGKGADLQLVNVELKDITDDGNTIINKSFPINEENESQIIKTQIKVPNKKHDYRAGITLKSQKNTYSSTPFFIRFSEKYSNDGIKYMYFSPYGFAADYVDNVEKVSLNLKKGQRFYFLIEYNQLTLKENSIQVKLDGKYELKIDTYSYGTFYDGNVGIYCILPDDIDPGLYKLHVYVNGLEYILDYQIKILRGSSEILYIDSRPGKDGYLGVIANYFVIKDNVYYVHDSGGVWSVLCFNMKTMKWEKKKNASIEDSQYISKEKISTNDKNYFIFQTYNMIGYREYVTLGEYNDKSDSWTQLSKYPGLGDRDLTTFAVDNDIYIGGGLNMLLDEHGLSKGEEEVNDFWKYNLITKEWRKLDNLPYYSSHYYDYINSTTTHENNAFVFTATRQLWKYNVLNDKWEELISLKNGTYNRLLSQLIYYKNKLYLTPSSRIINGNTIYSNDVWVYDFTSSTWELLDTQEYYFNQPYGRAEVGLPAFIYNDILYLGCGTLSSSYEKDLFYKIKID